MPDVEEQFAIMRTIGIAAVFQENNRLYGFMYFAAADGALECRRFNHGRYRSARNGTRSIGISRCVWRDYSKYHHTAERRMLL